MGFLDWVLIGLLGWAFIVGIVVGRNLQLRLFAEESLKPESEQASWWREARLKAMHKHNLERDLKRLKEEAK